MRWFRSKPPRFPADMVQRLEMLGRFQLDPRTSGIDAGEVWRSCLAPFTEDANDDPDDFLISLSALVAADRGGFAVFGAAVIVWELFGDAALRNPAAWPLIDGGTDFKLARGLSNMHLTGYEKHRLDQRRDPRGDGAPL